jgi:pilus assembly protein CpaE
MWLIDLFREGNIRPRSWAKHEDGASAVEFSLFLPVIVLGCVTMGDIGLAVQQRMTLDQVVRAGAQVAMRDPGEEQVLSALKLSASKNFPLEDSADDQEGIVKDPVSVDVTRYCSCPDDRAASVSCSTACVEAIVPFVFYRMTVARNYDGIITPAFSLARAMEIQIR